MENIIWRAIAVFLTAFPIAWIGYRMELHDQVVLKGLVTSEELRGFLAARITGSFASGFIAVVVFGFVYVLINEAMAIGLRRAFQRLRKTDNQIPNAPEVTSGLRPSEPHR